jgi:hypothetical protein
MGINLSARHFYFYFYFALEAFTISAGAQMRCAGRMPELAFQDSNRNQLIFVVTIIILITARYEE